MQLTALQTERSLEDGAASYSDALRPAHQPDRQPRPRCAGERRGAHAARRSGERRRNNRSRGQPRRRRPTCCATSRPTASGKALAIASRISTPCSDRGDSHARQHADGVRIGAERIGRQQAEWLRTQQLSSGRRLLAPSDDPLAAAQALRARQSRSLGERYLANQGAARTTALAGWCADAGSAVQDARTLMVQATPRTVGCRSGSPLGVRNLQARL